jgi:hypothetical protein
MSDYRIDLSSSVQKHGRTLVHLRGYHGDGGENESVLSIAVDLSPGSAFPESGRIFVGSPQQSPLLDGYVPDLGSFSCTPDAADRLADELKAAASAARAAMAPPTNHKSGTGDTFRKRPVIIHAVQFTGEQPDPPGVWRRDEDHSPYVVTIHDQRCYVVPGDWIIPEPDGVHYRREPGSQGA